MSTSTDRPLYLDHYVQALEDGDSEAALRILQQACTDHPGSGTPHALLAAQLMHAGEVDAAEAAFIRALALDPDLSTARFQLGLLQFTSARPQTAFQTWASLETLGESHYLVCFKRAFAALAMDCFDDALFLIEQGMSRNDENAPLNQDMGMLAAHIRTQRGDASTDSAVPQNEAAAQFVLASYKQNL